MEFEKVKSYLSRQVDNNGTSIYSHIADISRKIVDEKLENAYDEFENLSLAVKQSKLKVESANDIPVQTVNEEERAEVGSHIDSILTSYGRKPEKKAKAIKEDGDEDDEEEEDDADKDEDVEPIDASKCANILEHQQLISWSGLCMESEEAYQLQHSVIRLVRKFGDNFEHSRFWGKILAMDSDYYIVEAKLTEYPEPKEEAEDATEPTKNEDPGKGANEFVYFVTPNIENGEWRQLSDVTAEQIKKSRRIHRLFTGDLNAKVGGRVHFEWCEAELLRAQIARISAATVLAPNEFYQKPEEDDEEDPFAMELNEEFAPNEEGGVASDSWVHSRGHLRLEGRVAKWIAPEKEDEEDDEDGDAEKEETEPTAEELEEEIPILQSIASDVCAQFANGDDEDDEAEGSNVWNIRTLNEQMAYKVIVLSNKVWDGAKTIYRSNSSTFVNVYIGDGIKYRATFYTPTPPLAIQPQFDEMKEVEAEENEDAEENENEDEDKEPAVKFESIFVAQSEVMPPPPPPPQENEDGDDAEQEDEDAE